MDYEFPVLPKWKDMIEFLGANENINFFLYGFGRIAKETADVLLQWNKKVAGIVDRKEFGDISYKNIPVLTPDQLKVNDEIVLVCTDIYYKEIVEQLNKNGVFRVAPYYIIYCGKRLSYRDYNKINRVAARLRFEQLVEERSDSILLEGLDVVITEKCSLRCKECSNLMQYFENPVDTDYSLCIQSLDLLLTNISYVREVNILGGEPFCNRMWIDYVDWVSKYHNIGNILIYTNATICPKDEDLQRLKDKRIVFLISDYGKVSINLQKLRDKLEKYEINYTITKVSEWVKCGEINPHYRTDEQNRKTFALCCMKGVFSLKDGYIYGCPFAGNAAALRAVPKELNECFYVKGSIDIKEDIKKMQEKSFLKICDWCEGRGVGYLNIPAAEQIKHPRQYKRYY